VRALDHGSRKRLRRLNTHHSGAIDCSVSAIGARHADECIYHRDCSRDSISCSCFSDYGFDHLLRHERSRSIVNDHYLDVVTKIFQSIAHGIAAFSSADRQQESLGVALEQPWWRISDVFVRQDDNNHRNVFPLLKCLDAVEQHRLARNPPKLLQLVTAGAASLSAGDNDNADVFLHWKS
jgi:hypothetical protein